MTDITVIEHKPTTKQFQIRSLSEAVEANLRDLLTGIPLLWVIVATCEGSQEATIQLTKLLQDHPELGG